MATLVFTSHLRHVGPTEPHKYAGASVLAVLNHAFQDFPQLKSYVLDDQNHLRKHVAIFVDGLRLDRDNALSAKVAPTSEIFVLQALSGG